MAEQVLVDVDALPIVSESTSMNELVLLKKSSNFGSYQRTLVSCLDERSEAREWFDTGLQLMFGYNHELAADCFFQCLTLAPQCAMAYGFLAYCHAPNYNFTGAPYYNSSYDPNEAEIDFAEKGIADYNYPSQVLCERFSSLAVSIMLKTETTEKERGILSAVHNCCKNVGVESSMSEKLIGRPFAHEMKALYAKYNDDAEIAYIYLESLMVLNAWKLYKFPHGVPDSPDVDEIVTVIEMALSKHPNHAGLCHLYVHLCEMSSNPEKALPACNVLRTRFPDSGHLLHMATHIDVLTGDYESVVRFNKFAIDVELKLKSIYPKIFSPPAFYFGYMAHNFHMLVYGAMLGGMESIGMKYATKCNSLLVEQVFIDNPDVEPFLGSYTALDIHLLVRFGRWRQILQLPFPRNKQVMLYRTATLRFARGIAFCNIDDSHRGNLKLAQAEADMFDKLRSHPAVSEHILHNNLITSIFAVDAYMLEGEIAYKQGYYQSAFDLLEHAIHLSDQLSFDEPWGKMQPVRHALGGFLLKQGKVSEAIEVYKTDLKIHPNNPWSLSGLVDCLEQDNISIKIEKVELDRLRQALSKQRQSEWVDFHIAVSCACATN